MDLQETPRFTPAKQCDRGATMVASEKGDEKYTITGIQLPGYP